MRHEAEMSRREFLAATAAVTAAAVACRTADTRPTPPMDAGHLVELSALDAVAAMRRGEVKAEDYAAALLARCEAGKPLNAFITLEPAGVLEAARAADRRRASGVPLGPLHGLPIPIKDSVNTKDLPTTGGTQALRNFRPKEDAPVVRALRDAGAIVLGKTNIHELSLGWTSNNLAFGAVHNPYDPTRIPGGSSGGTAAAVAARMAPLGVAEDTEGSIRVPAALCGICGFRPTTKRYPSSGVVPISPLFDQVGPHARRVTDLALFDSVAAQDGKPLEQVPLAGVRLGVARGYYFGGLDPEVERVIEEALAKLRAAGVVVVEAEVPDVARLVELITGPVQIHDVVPSVTKYLEEFGAPVTFDQVLAAASRDVKGMLEMYAVPGAKKGVPEKAYQAARDVHLPVLKENFRAYFDRNKVAAIGFPTTMVPATPIGEAEVVEIGGKKVPFFTAVSRNIAPGSTAGLPGLVLPAGLTRTGLPVGMELDGPATTDRALLALGVAIEQVLGHPPAPALSRT